MKRVIITGASGFVGHHLLAAAPPKLEILALRGRNPIFLPDAGFQSAQIDLAAPDWSAVLDFAPDVIIHAAALSQIKSCEENPELARQVNVEASAQLADIAARSNARMIYTSTDLVFDGRRGNYSESDPVNPSNVYAKTKYEGECAVRERNKNSVVARLALVYGKSLNGNPTFTENMIQTLQSGRPMNLFSDEFRTPVLVNDLVAAMWELAINDFRGLIHLGGARRVSRYEMGRAACQVLDLNPAMVIPSSVESFDPQGKRPRDCSFDTRLAQKTLSVHLTGFEDGLRRAFQPTSQTP